LRFCRLLRTACFTLSNSKHFGFSSHPKYFNEEDKFVPVITYSGSLSKRIGNLQNAHKTTETTKRLFVLRNCNFQFEVFSISKRSSLKSCGRLQQIVSMQYSADVVSPKELCLKTDRVDDPEKIA
jgi:hypothetical protein